MSREELKEKEQELVVGGELPFCPSEDILKEYGLGDYVRNRVNRWKDTFYDVYRGDGVWEQVGSKDMLAYVEQTLGSDDERYLLLYDLCMHGIFDFF